MHVNANSQKVISNLTIVLILVFESAMLIWSECIKAFLILRWRIKL